MGKKHWMFKASKAEQLSFARKMLTEQHADLSLREVVDLQREEGDHGSVFDSFLIRDCIPTPTPGNGLITLNSAHAIPPYREQGANMACLDAFTPGRLIVEEVEAAATFDAQKVIRKYE